MDLLFAHAHRIAWMGLLLALSNFFSGSETAFFSLGAVELRRLRAGRGPLSRAVAALAREPAEFLSTVLFCNLLVNVFFYSLASNLASAVHGRYGAGAAFFFSLGALFLLITVGEVAPKSLGVLAPGAFFSVAAIPMLLLHEALAPVRPLLRGMTRRLRRFQRHRTDARGEKIGELKMLLDACAAAGELSESESDIVSAIVDLPDIRVKECMTPRVDLVMVKAGAEAGTVVSLARSTGRRRFPVFHRHGDEIVGVVDAREIFLAGGKGPLAPFLHRPVYVSAYQRLDDTLRILRREPLRQAIVLDEYGGTAGIVTLSDIFEEIFGAEAEAEGSPVRALGADRYAVSGSLSLRDWRELLRFPGALPPVNTVSGLVTCLLGHFPQPGESIRLGRVEMTVKRVLGHRVAEVDIQVLTEEGAGEAAPARGAAS
ncbi:MAG: hemolysin family protein [Planctomycetota bacterium]